jgi:hypothetical protein
MFITPLLEVAKFLAEAGTFARDICKPKSPVKGVFLTTTQKIGFLQLPFLRDQQSARPDRPLETESAWHPDHCGKKLSRRIRSEST